MLIMKSSLGESCKVGRATSELITRVSKGDKVSEMQWAFSHLTPLDFWSDKDSFSAYLTTDKL